MDINVKLDNGAYAPVRSHPYDGGLDLRTPVGFVVPPCSLKRVVNETRLAFEDRINVGSYIVDTGIHVQIPEGYVGLIKSRSGLFVNNGLTVDGVIDSHYTGSIAVKMLNHTDVPYSVEPGNKIAQLVIIPCLTGDVKIIDDLGDTDRGDNGFGSTGR